MSVLDHCSFLLCNNVTASTVLVHCHTSGQLQCHLLSVLLTIGKSRSKAHDALVYQNHYFYQNEMICINLRDITVIPAYAGIQGGPGAGSPLARG